MPVILKCDRCHVQQSDGEALKNKVKWREFRYNEMLCPACAAAFDPIFDAIWKAFIEQGQVTEKTP